MRPCHGTPIEAAILRMPTRPAIAEVAFLTSLFFRRASNYQAPASLSHMCNCRRLSNLM